MDLAFTAERYSPEVSCHGARGFLLAARIYFFLSENINILIYSDLQVFIFLFSVFVFYLSSRTENRARQGLKISLLERHSLMRLKQPPHPSPAPRSARGGDFTAPFILLSTSES